MIEPIRLSLSFWTCLVVALLSAAVLMAGCAPPDDALVASCETEALAIGDPTTCRVRATRVPRYQSVSFEITSYSSPAVVAVKMQLVSGEVKVSIRPEDRVSPASPAFTATVPIGSAKRFILVEPTGARRRPVGTVDYKTPRAVTRRARSAIVTSSSQR